MFKLLEYFVTSRGFYYLLGVSVVAFVIFTTAAKRPKQRCSRCHEKNRPIAHYCAHCGQPLDKS